MWLLVKHAKPTNTLYWSSYLLEAGNYKSASGQLQNNSVNGTMLITINHVISTSNHMIGRISCAISDKLREYIFDNFESARGQ